MTKILKKCGTNTTKMLYKYGILWHCEYDKWKATVYDRYTLSIWKFGNIWQCRIDIPHDVNNYPNANSGYVSLGTRIGLEPNKSRDASMKKALKWVEDYRKNGPQTWEQICRNCYDTYPTLFKRESDVIKHVFFTIGNGYSWLDGHITNEHPDDEKHIADGLDELLTNTDQSILEMADRWEDEGGAIPSNIKKYAEEVKERQEEKLLLSETHRLPLSELKEGIKFEQLSPGYSNILCIPNDVSDEYLLLCAKIWHKFLYKNTNKKISQKSKEKYHSEFHNRFKERLSKFML